MAQTTPGDTPATMLADRALLRLSGEGVRDWLQGLVTSDVLGALPVWAGLLSAQGKAIADFIVWEAGDALLLDVAAADAELLARRLSIYRLRRPITIAVEPALAVHWAPDGQQGVADPRHPALGRRWLGPPAAPARGWEAQRLRLGVAEGAAELGDTLWLECNAAELGGVSFTKGCYVGQENTARMNWRAKVNRRLVVVRGIVEGARRTWPDLGLSLVHARVGAVPDDAIIPDWLDAALAG